jgi:hypothetical protein
MKTDSEGYNSKGRRQILGYSRLAQGGADAARARANQRVYESQDHLYEDGRSIQAARQRAQRVARAKHEGTFEETKDTYNEEAADMGSDVAMDNAGTITRKKRADYTAPTAYTPKKPARSTPMSMARPAGQKVAETVAMTEPAGLMDMARKARRRGTLVVK